ncbi:hypothetical protein Ddye_018556 [Dipteronia dyeriana]|uniref:RNase H type-1 domain-containing protein n=1 Tax=Dipteronia dyeriana TaxID=168575 RepID=A0AAD9UAV3_9ROSI|nr:hypothetical protein Ddye_018556 [Dipteronia dyeriana]
MVPPLVVEAMAVQWGIQMAVSEGIRPFLVESNSLQVANLANNGVPSSADVGPITSDIIDSLESLPRCSISHVSGGGNLAAHVLAKEVLLAERDSVWVDFCPPCVERIVLADGSS